MVGLELSLYLLGLYGVCVGYLAPQACSMDDVFLCCVAVLQLRLKLYAVCVA